MNAIAAHLAHARHRITVQEAWAMETKRVFGDQDFELIDGELVFMPQDGGPTIRWNSGVAAWLIPTLLDRPVVVVPDKTLILSEHDGPKPDFYVYPAVLRVEDVRGPDVLLVIEVADTTLREDLGWKAELYAQFGVREYWVVDVNGRQVFAHRLRAEGGYGAPAVFTASEPVTPGLLPGIALRLDALRYV
jgi:Uma2 family endonuclease